MWKVTKHKCSNTKTELNVSIIVKDVATIDWITSSDSLENHIKERIRYIPSKNGFCPEHAYQVSKIGLRSVEIWKTSPAGHRKYKMFTLDFIPQVN